MNKVFISDLTLYPEKLNSSHCDHYGLSGGFWGSRFHRLVVFSGWEVAGDQTFEVKGSYWLSGCNERNIDFLWQVDTKLAMITDSNRKTKRQVLNNNKHNKIHKNAIKDSETWLRASQEYNPIGSHSSCCGDFDLGEGVIAVGSGSHQSWWKSHWPSNGNLW